MHDGVTTTAGEVFTSGETEDLARLIFKRFGNDFEAARQAMERLLESSIDCDTFYSVLYSANHTHYCQGECLVGTSDWQREQLEQENKP